MGTSTIESSQRLQEVAEDADVAAQASSNVTEVVVIGAGICHAPPALFTLSLLVRLDLSHNRLTSIPSAVRNLKCLKVLNLSSNALVSLPGDLGVLTGLTDLDAGRNRLSRLPAHLCSASGLKYLNLQANNLTTLPEEFGNLKGLVRLGLKSNALVELPSSFSRLTSLVELFLTDNQLRGWPEGFGSLPSLVKLQASFNLLSSLPKDIWLGLSRLEMLRVAVCQVEPLQDDLVHLGGLPSLAWASLAGNPASPTPQGPPEGLRRCRMEDLGLGAYLGKGASGEVFVGELDGRPVAVKRFMGEVSPDGRTAEEVAISCSVQHPNLTHVLAFIQEPQGLVMELVADSHPLASRPTSEHLLRCRWDPSTQFSLPGALRILAGVASALEYLHHPDRRIAHGDVYAHNVLVDASGHATMCDFGAAFCYPAGQTFWEAMEVRAFGLLLKDIAERTSDPSMDQAGAAATAATGGTPAGEAADQPSVGGGAAGTAGQGLQPQEQEQQQHGTGAPAATPEAQLGGLRRLHALAAECLQPAAALRPRFAAVVSQLEGWSAEVS